MSDYEPRSGDHVRVVLEGKVGSHAVGIFDVRDTRGNNYVLINPERDYFVSVEKVEPPTPDWVKEDTVLLTSARLGGRAVQRRYGVWHYVGTDEPSANDDAGWVKIVADGEAKVIHVGGTDGG